MEMLNQKDELKRTKQAFILFMIGEICLMLGALSMGADFKFLPRWLESFAFFDFVAFLLSFIALCLLRKLHVSFTYSAISVGVLFVAMTFDGVCLTSEESLYLLWGKGLGWTCDLLLCLYHVYFLQGCLFIFKKYNDEKMSKKVKQIAIIYLAIFATFIIFKIGTTIPAILKNTIANRVFIFGTLFFTLSTFIFTLINVIYISIKVSIIRKEEHNDVSEN